MADTDNVVPFDARDWASRERREQRDARRRRIRRGPDLPEDLAHDVATGVRYPLRLKSPDPQFEIHYRRDRWSDVTWQELVFTRTTVAWLVKGGERVGGIQFTEYRFDVPLSNNEVFDALDGLSDESARVGDLVTLMWKDFTEEVGDIVELETVWASPRLRRPDLILHVTRQLLRHPLRRRELFVAHVFPLEYSHRVWEGTPSNVGFERRLAALTRAAERHLELKPFPGPAADLGWMYRLNPCWEMPEPHLHEEPKTTLLW
jgi:hypothetical protein